jgi:CheY-like chemotaxis protein
VDLPPLVVAGLDSRGLLLEAPVLLRDRHPVFEVASIRELLEAIVVRGASLVVLGTRLPDAEVPDAIRQIRGSSATRHVSVLALVPAGEPAQQEARCVEAGANAVLRRPLDRAVLESWLTKLLVVPRRVQARFAVQGQVVGSSRDGSTGHFYGLTQNVSVNGMLLASPIPLGVGPDIDLEFDVPGLSARLRALGRIVREAPEVAWPYLGYGVEFLFVPPESQEALSLFISRGLSSLHAPPAPDRPHGIHSTVHRAPWVYEILEPVGRDGGFQAEIRRGARDTWRPGQAGPFYVLEARTRDAVLAQAREFIQRHG